MAKHYQTKSRTLECVRFTGSNRNISELSRWMDGCTVSFACKDASEAVETDCGKPAKVKVTLRVAPARLKLSTLAGMVLVPLGDWVVKDQGGNFWHCSDGMFRRLFHRLPQ